MPESAALSREGLLWVLMWAHTALMAEYEAVMKRQNDRILKEEIMTTVLDESLGV